MILPTCPREDCTAAVNHWHYRRPAGAVENCRGGRCGHCPTSSGSRCYAPRETAPPASPTPATDARTPQLAPEPAPAASDAHTGTRPLTLPTVLDVAQAIQGTFSDEPWEGIGEHSRLRYRSEARSVLDLIAARQPVWQPFEPGTVIKAGTRVREDRDDQSTEWTLINEWTLGEDLIMDPHRRYSFDPRTIPADPDADLIEFTAEKIHGDIGCDSDWPCVSHAESIRRETRGLIEAVRRLTQDVTQL